jgi:excisionase family DNA binding protein
MANDRNINVTAEAQRPRSGTREAHAGQPAEMFTAKELQQLLKISAKTIYGYVQRGLIPYVRIQSNVRFPKREILEWIDRQTYQPR